MKVANPNVKLPSKSRYIAQVNNFAPSNLYRQSQGSNASLMSTATKSFPQNMFPQENQFRATIKKENEADRTVSLERTVKSNMGTMKKSQRPQSESKKTREGRDEHKKAGSLFSGSSVSVQFSPKPSRKSLKSPKPKGAKKKRVAQSEADAKRMLPGNYDYPNVLFKGVFQNNYMMANTIEVKDQEMYEVPVRNSYKYYEEQYKMNKKAESDDHQISHKHLESRLSLYKLIETEDLNPLQNNRKKITLSENFNNSQNYLNPNFLPSYIDFHQFPGQIGSVSTVSDREKSVIYIQKIVRGMLTRIRVGRMKNTLKRHFSGERELDPYELEFFDLNVPVFQEILANNGTLPTKAKENKSETLKEESAERKLLSNTFYSVLRSGFFPEDPMDYVVLAELRDEQDAIFPKLLQEEEKIRSKEVMLTKKYEYLFGKPSIAREIKTDEMSVVKNFLKSNLNSISEADLKFPKFQTDYKSIIKPKSKPTVSLFEKATRSPATKDIKRFDTQAFAMKTIEHEIKSEITEDYPDDFDGESDIKESIQESFRKDLTQSLIKDSIRESIIGGDSKGRDNYMNDSIRESIVDQSSPGKFDKRYSTKSISEEIMRDSIGLGRNASFKSIQEEIPISESIDNSHVNNGKGKKLRKKSDEIEEDIDYKDSYGDEDFESLQEESIQESIEKFQSLRKSTSPSVKTGKSVISPQKVNEDKVISSKPFLKKFSTKEEEEISPIEKILPSSIQKPKTAEVVKEKKELKEKDEIRHEISEDSYNEEKYERRRPKIDPNLLDIPVSNKADILFANFQKELEKMVYVENMTQNVRKLESAIENVYNQKEVNLLHSLQRNMNNNNNFKSTHLNNNVPNIPNENTLEHNSVVFLMQKYNSMERSMTAISKQLNFLVNNFTGGKATDVSTSSINSQRKPRPIVPVRKSQNIRNKQPSISVATQPEKKPELEVKSQNVVQRPKEVEVKKVEAIKPQVQDIQPKKIEVPVKKEEPISKPKFSFKLPTPQEPVNKSLDESEEKENQLSLNLPNINKQESAAIKVESNLLVDEKASTYKSTKFGNWQESSSDRVSEEIVEDLEEEPQVKQIKKEKSSEEEVDFSAKEYSDSFEKVSNLTPKRSFIPTFQPKEPENVPQDSSSGKVYSESFEDLTPKSSNKTPTPPQKTEKAQPKKEEITEEDIDEFIIDEDIDLPSEGDVKEVTNKPIFPAKVEPKQETIIETKPKQDEFENVEFSDEYGEEDFEELSLASETKEEKPVQIIKPPKEEKPSPEPIIETKPHSILQHFEFSESEDIEASQDFSTISWQDDIFPPFPLEKIEPKKVLEKKNEIIAEVKEVPKELPVKKALPPLEDPKAKAKQNLLEHQNYNIHQEPTPVPNEKEVQEQTNPEEIKQKEHIAIIKNQVTTIVEKMNQAKKDQLVNIMINHIHNAPPEERLSIFDKNPVKDQAIVDAYNEIFLNLFRSEFRKLSNEFANIKEVETRMQIKLNGLIIKSRDILVKKSALSNIVEEDYKTLGNNFTNIYETLKDKKIAGEENEFYEEEDDIKRLVEEENNKLKEAIADDVMEALFEETIKDLMRIAQDRKKF